MSGVVCVASNQPETEVNVIGTSSALRRGASHYPRVPTSRQCYAAGRGVWRSFSHKLARDIRCALLVGGVGR